jgi:hypothetical protein
MGRDALTGTSHLAQEAAEVLAMRGASSNTVRPIAGSLAS